MNREQFIRGNEATWRELDALLTRLDKREKPANTKELPRLYRQVCRDLAVAQHRMYGIPLIDRLNLLVSRGYHHMYKGKSLGIHRFARFLMVGFPRAVRGQWRLFWLCMAMYWIPFFGLLIAARHAPEWIHSILGPAEMAGLEQSWGKGTEELDRGFGGDFMMFGFYIMNNIRIDFSMFASGMLFGIGTLFQLIFNGIQHGAAAGYVHMACDPEKFYSFVSGHSSYELIGMVIAGVAGMRLGLALLRPGRRTRVEALKAQLPIVLPLILGAGLLTFIAACVEGFWSAHAFPFRLKVAVGIAGWVLLAIYFVFAGRGAGPDEEATI